MPQLYEKAVMTDGGAALLSKAQSGKIKMEFTCAVTGNGIYSAEEKTLESLRKRSALKNQQNSYPLSGIEIMSDHTVKVTALVTNQNPDNNTVLVDEGYYITEMGLYAKEQGGNEETLFCIITAAEKGDYMPAYNGSSPAQIIQDYFITVSNTANVVVDVQNGAVALASDVMDIRKILKTKQDNFVSTVDLSGSDYDQDTWYPATGTPIPKGGLHKIHVYTTFDMGAHPSWATNAAGYTCNMELYDKAQTWGQTDGATICMDYSWKHTSQRPCGYIQMTHSSTPAVLLRGGGIYCIETDYATEWTVRTEAYTVSGDTVRPRNASKFEFERATIFADLDGNVDASMVTEDSTHRFVSDSEKAKWNQTDLSEKTVEFEENSSYEIASGESMGTLMGKLKKLISTVKSKAPNFLSSGRVPLTDKLHTKRYIDGVGFDGTEDICHFAVCDTDFDMQVKEVQVPSFEVLQGARITLYFTDGCDLNDSSFKINGRTYNTSCDGLIRYVEPGEMMDFIFYDGVWQNVGGQMRELFRVKSDAMMVVEENHALAVHAEVQGPSPIPSYIGIVSEEGYTVKCLSVKEGEHYRIHSKYYDLMYCHEILVKNMDSTKFYEGDYVDVRNDLTIPEGYNYLLISLPTADKRLHIYKLP